MRIPALFIAMILTLAACGGASGSTSDSDIADLPETDKAHFEDHLASLETPAVVNIWASWCLPCRSEAPLLNSAFESYGGEVEFIGVAVQDSQPDAKEFLAEFGLAFDHFFDRDREVPNMYAGIGTPITFFFAPGGVLVSTHNGVVDDRTLAVGIDELLLLDS